MDEIGDIFSSVTGGVSSRELSQWELDRMARSKVGRDLVQLCYLETMVSGWIDELAPLTGALMFGHARQQHPEFLTDLLQDALTTIARERMRIVTEMST